MYLLSSVSRDDMELSTAFYATKEDAITAMNESIETTCGDSIENIKNDLDENNGEFIDDTGACIQTNNWGTTIWAITEVPESVASN